MSHKPQPTPEEVQELFSELDASGVLALSPAGRERARKARARSGARVVDPLSGEDPSGSIADRTIKLVAGAFVLIVLLIVVGSQVGYGFSRRVNTTKLSDEVNYETVDRALQGGLEWGSGYTQFPTDYTVDAADENQGTIEVSVTDTTAKNELELLSSAQIQATALATNAFLNEKITRVVYNVSVIVNDEGVFQNSSLFGFIQPRGNIKSALTFTWTKHQSKGANGIDWECRITGVDKEIAERIQSQINSLSLSSVLPGAEDDGDEEEAAADGATTAADEGQNAPEGGAQNADGAGDAAADAAEDGAPAPNAAQGSAA